MSGVVLTRHGPLATKLDIDTLRREMDGRAGANPVREARMFPEADVEPRGLPYELVVRILDVVSATEAAVV